MTTLAGGAALLDGDRLVGETTVSIALTHSERLMVVVDRLLTDCGWSAKELEGLAVSIGPGSFTGLRVGIATVKGLALALGLPVAPVPTLDALAATLPFADAPVCPLLDARKGEVFCSLYRWRECEAVAAKLVAPVIVLGDGVPACRPYLARMGGGVREAPPARRLPSPATVAQLGHAMLAAGHGIAAEAVTPLYLRPSEAELKARRTA